MFDVGAPEFILLLVIAIVLFGPEKLPELIRKASGVVKYVRTMAGSAQEQLKGELGPGFEDIDLRDLNPKAFIQKHLLDDVDPIVADLKDDFTAAAAVGAGATAMITDAVDGQVKGVSGGGPNDVMAEATPARVLTPFDPDAT